MQARRTLNTARMCLLLVRILWETFEFFQENERPVGRDLETLAARLTDEVVIDANQMVLGLPEEEPVALIGAGRKQRLLRAA